MIAPFPTDDDFKRLGPTFPYDNLLLHPDDILQYFSSEHPVAQISNFGDILTWVNSFNGRVYYARRSYIFMSFYIETGIAENIELFTNEQYIIKDYFDYFADTFFYKLFSAWDTIGHIFNIIFHLSVDRPSFEKSLYQLKKSNIDAYHLYEPIFKDIAYRDAKDVRNDITHNVPPSIADQRPIPATPEITYFGVSKQVLSNTVFSTATNAIPLLERTVLTLKSRLAS